MHETLHAQSLILGLAFLAIWSPQNCMAPNLTQMATDFGFSDKERDFYLGANVALATGVLSFAHLRGDRHLGRCVQSEVSLLPDCGHGWIQCVADGCQSNISRAILARLLNGSFMSGSVPVAFSLLGDLFDTHRAECRILRLDRHDGPGHYCGPGICWCCRKQ
jgi:MFS family permease